MCGIGGKPCYFHQDLIMLKLNRPKREIAYSMDLLIPGVYFWFGSKTFSVGGAEVSDYPHRYPWRLKSKIGFAVVLPGLKIFSTYKGMY